MLSCLISKSTIISIVPSEDRTNRSRPAPPVSASAPPPSRKISSPSRPDIWSALAPPDNISSPEPPLIVSPCPVPTSASTRFEISTAKTLNPASAPDATARCSTSPMTEKLMAETASSVLSSVSSIATRCSNRPSSNSSNTETPSSPPAAAR